jgi:hypothetical protein
MVNNMWVLVMLTLTLHGTDGSILFYNDELVCKAAAKQFEAQSNLDFRLKAFCIKGE